MTFEHNGVRYRIGFRHEKSRRWVDHSNHEVRLIRDGGTGPGVIKHFSGPAVLYCVQCELKLAPLSRAERARNVHCTIWFKTGMHAEGGKEWPLWQEVAKGRSHLNVQAGDQYDREKGRVAALRDALAHSRIVASDDDAAFREALWQWFLHGRKRSAVERAAAAKGGR